MSPVLRQAASAAGVRLAWFGLAVLLALGSAGIAAGIDATPGSPARAELTWSGDVAARPLLAAAADDLGLLALDVEALGVKGRGALASLVARDLDELSAAIADGSAILDEIEVGTERVRGLLRDVPGIGLHDELRLGRDLRDRYDTILASLAATADLDRSWVRLTTGSVAATSLTTLLADHDRYAAEAARLGSGARYAQALDELTRAETALAEARKLRDQLANTVDVTVLDQWLERNGALDTALRRLYAALVDSNGSATQGVRDALRAVDLARRNLPPDTRGLVLIMAEIARGGLNQAVIAIEEARGRLAASVEAVRAAEGSGG